MSGKGSVMYQRKLAAILVTPLAFLCAVAAAQNQPPPETATRSTSPAPIKTSPIHTQTQTAPPIMAQPSQQVSSPNASNVAPPQKRPTILGTGSDALPTACPTPVYAVRPGDVYGPYVPYVPSPTACPTPISTPATNSPSSANASTVEKPQPDSFIKSAPLNLADPSTLALATEAAPAPAEAPAEGGDIRPVPTRRAATIGPDLRPFRSYAAG